MTVFDRMIIVLVAFIIGYVAYSEAHSRIESFGPWQWVTLAGKTCQGTLN
jgi:hypothetical protein